ncbi:GIY-YIG nuclease family protein [Mycoplasma sp. CSL7475-4]|uniref:GIY-YIG nuclease family protein n=1 Tax=Mycoplasma sp. CSL7475-4 TaxID=2973942 RepID=UPI00216ACC52|nr:GIY-YIG nuclease family protein [Mycoplasma sp. CSL7475-4]MCS4536807.1 GIY-YIG nuclease family protein [Mycoplasma sp. CSL7475-4]
MNKFLEKKLELVPKQPGVYLWKDANNKVIYVGKAKNLNRRMHQYFEGAINSYKTTTLVQKIVDFEIFISRNDKEALLLEKQLIDKYNPEYNILLLDDKWYPYIKIELKPKSLDISIVRKITKKESAHLFYFGPFPQGYGASVILKLLEREAFFENGLKVKNEDFNYWKEKFNFLKNIVTFKHKYISELEQKMHESSAKLQFEIALDIKNSLQYLKKISEDQIIELKNFKNIDVFTYCIKDERIYITLLFYRHGNLIGKDNVIIDIYVDINETLNNFFQVYYANKHIPENVIADDSLKEYDFVTENEINFIFPKIGLYKKILAIANLNLDDFVKNTSTHMLSLQNKAFNNLKDLAKYTGGLVANNIVVFDNSNLANNLPVGVAIAICGGLKNKLYYRSFNHSENNLRQADVEYMRLSIEKYFNSDKNLLPDLIIVDGGLAQVREAKNVLTKLERNIKVIGLVKNDQHRTSRIIDVDEKACVIKPQSLKNFLTGIQDEVDRFAKSVFWKRKKISSLEGKLQRIKGLGSVYEDKLLKYFKTYNNIYNAPLSELEKVIPKNIAKKIFNKEFLKGE